MIAHLCNPTYSHTAGKPAQNSICACYIFQMPKNTALPRVAWAMTWPEHIKRCHTETNMFLSEMSDSLGNSSQQSITEPACVFALLNVDAHMKSFNWQSGKLVVLQKCMRGGSIGGPFLFLAVEHTAAHMYLQQRFPEEASKEMPSQKKRKGKHHNNRFSKETKILRWNFFQLWQ